jgi:hypothetical protein
VAGATVELGMVFTSGAAELIIVIVVSLFT